MTVRDRFRTAGSRLRSTGGRARIVVPTVAAVAVLGAGGAWWMASADDSVSGRDADRAGEAALAEVGGGRVTDVDRDRDATGTVYEIEVLDTDGVEWDVVLDEDFAVLTSTREDADDRDDRGAAPQGGAAQQGSATPQGGAPAADDADAADPRFDREDAVSARERTRVIAAAEGAVEGGTVTDVDRSDDRGEAWEVELVDAQGLEWDVTLDADYAVLDTRRD